MKKEYVKPTIEVIIIETEDIMNTSGRLGITRDGDGEIEWWPE